MTTPSTGLELRSLVDSDGQLRVTLEQVPVPRPGHGEVLVRVEASPINPSDLGLLLGPVDPTSLRREGDTLVGEVPAGVRRALTARVGQSLPVGNEGAGTVIAAGEDVADMIGRTVAVAGGAMYAQYRLVPARTCLTLPPGADARSGAGLFVNPLTALGFVETMRREGHGGIVHTAAASNLGQMLLRIALADGIPLVNVVRSQAQAELLRGQGATHVVDTTAPDFPVALEAAIAETGATIGFDAVGGGPLAGQILTAMETVAARALESYSRYGSESAKQVYIYGMLDPGPTILDRRFGFSWGVGGWLLFPFLRQIGEATAQRMRERVVAEHATTFASHYTAAISLSDMLKPEIAVDYARKATGGKYLVEPVRA